MHPVLQELLHGDLRKWNQWRDRNPQEPVEASNLDISTNTQFSGVGVNLRNTNFNKCKFNSQFLRGAAFIGAQLNHCDFSGCNLENSNFSGANLYRCNFDLTNASNAQFSNCAFTECTTAKANFTDTDFRGALLHDTHLDHCDFTRAQFGSDGIRDGAAFNNCSFSAVNFSGSDLHGINLDDFTGTAVFTRANLSRATLRAAKLRNTLLQSANLTGADLRQADLAGAALPNSDLKGADLRDCDLKEANLSNARMGDCKLDACDLQAAQLSSVDLRGRDLRSVALARATVSSCKLDECNLSGVDLSRSDLGNSSLRSANLSDTNLDGCNLAGADLTEASLTRCSVNSATSLTGAITLGCEIDRFSLECLNNYGGLTPGDRARMSIRDPVLEIRAQYSGFSQSIHLISIAAFAAPYAWFLVSKYSVSRFTPGSENDPTLLISLLKYISSGGASWHGPWELHWSAATFVLLLLYNTARFSLIHKARRLEIMQEASGLPASISLSTGLWAITFKTANGLFWVYLLAVAIQSIHFLMQRIPAPQ